MKLRHKPWLFKYILRGYAAITIYPYVFTKEKHPSNTLVNHERIHCDQMKRDGVIKFYIIYLLQYLRFRIRGKGHWDSYFSISYEREAYDNQSDMFYQVKRKR